MRDDQRQRIVMFRTHMDDVNVEPSISVMKFGSALSFASIVRQSYSLAQ